ncbi:hypothetical protein [Flavobacterium mekongense]|uniref:hypothetical protein n=1 Tax=Flavobacterium mekongense TaxID=3379707 RepID=UPI00399B02BF
MKNLIIEKIEQLAKLLETIDAHFEPQKHKEIQDKIDLLNSILSDLTKKILEDRFYLEEAIFRNVKCWDEAEEYTDTLLHDWLAEMVRNNPLTEEERADFIKNVLGWDKDFAESAYFKSEKQLAHYLETKEILDFQDEEPENYSITDISTKN